MADADWEEKRSGYKWPTTLAGQADYYGALRDKRLAAQKQVDVLQAEETILKEYLIMRLPEMDASGVAGKKYRVSLVSKDQPQVDDWDALQRYIKRTGSFEILGRRLSAAAIKERWADGKTVPGVSSVTLTTLSVGKAK